MKKNFDIIVTQLGNLDELDDVIYRSYSHLMLSAYSNKNLDNALPFIAKANSGLVQSGKYYAATINGKIVACGGWSFERPGSGQVEKGIGHLRHFATLPEYSGQGIGATLYNFSKIEAKKLNVQRFECYSSLNAVKFYEGLGFSIIKEEEIVLPGGVVFACTLMGNSDLDG